jgi:hypothetical protein
MISFKQFFLLETEEDATKVSNDIKQHIDDFKSTEISKCRWKGCSNLFYTNHPDTNIKHFYCSKACANEGRKQTMRDKSRRVYATKREWYKAYNKAYKEKMKNYKRKNT